MKSEALMQIYNEQRLPRQHASQLAQETPIPSPPFFKKSILLQCESANDNPPPRVVLTRTAKAKMDLYEVKYDFADYALKHGEYYESKIYANHFHVRCLNKELIVTLTPTDIIVITYHNTYNEESASDKQCNNIYRAGIVKTPDLSWIRGTKQQPRPKSVSPQHASSVIKHIIRPATTSPPPVNSNSRAMGQTYIPHQRSPLNTQRQCHNF